MKSQKRYTEKKKISLKKVNEKALTKLLDKMHKYKTMTSYCLKCKKRYRKYKSKSFTNYYNKTMFLSKRAICGSKKIEIY